jgi:hypothetical protein
MPDPLGASCNISVSKPYSQGVCQWIETILFLLFFCLSVNNDGVIMQQCRLRRGGFNPALTDEEVITIEICGEYFKLECDKDIFAYFRAHYLHFFPKLADRSLFVRQAANLWQIKAAIQQHLTRNLDNSMILSK